MGQALLCRQLHVYQQRNSTRNMNLKNQQEIEIFLWGWEGWGHTPQQYQTQLAHHVERARSWDWWLGQWAKRLSCV